MNQSSWLLHLPLVFQGPRTAVEEDIKCSSTEIVYDTTLTLGTVFLRLLQNLLNITSFVDRLTARMANLAYNSPTQSQRPTYVPKLQ